MNTVTFPDTNVILRYLLADNKEHYEKARLLFEAVREGREKVILLAEVLLETFYVLTKTYSVPPKEAAEVLKKLVLYKGTVNRDKKVLIEAFDLFLESSGLSLLDCFLCVKAKRQKGKLFTFDERLRKICGSN